MATAVELAASGDFDGAYELQVLEAVLRRSDSPTSARAEQEVCRHIARKIGWQAEIPPADVHRFLTDFYEIQRDHLEGRMLMRERRQSKHDR